jgi:MFS transporter, PPP family, 3-phenylpropionic acid transporter
VQPQVTVSKLRGTALGTISWHDRFTPGSSETHLIKLLLAAPLCRFILLYSVLYLSFGAASPFLPSFLESRGISPEELGIVFAAGTATRLMAAPIAARVADRYNALGLVLAACAAAAAVAALFYLPASSFQAALVVSLLQAAALAPTTNLADALALLASKDKSGGGFEYGWVRGAGSAAFIAGSMIAGLAISAYGLTMIVFLQSTLLMAVPLAVRWVPAPMVPAADRAKEPSTVGILVLARSPAFRRVVLVAALVLGSHAMHDTFAMIRWRAAGISPWQTSLLWSIAVAAEVVVFFFIGPSLLRYLTAPGSMALAAVCGAIRWFITAISADVVAVAVTQPLHGFTFALLHLACMQLLARIVPRELAATAQAVYGTLGIGVATASLMLLSGWLYARFGPSAFLSMSLLCLIALALLPALNRLASTEATVASA